MSHEQTLERQVTLVLHTSAPQQAPEQLLARVVSANRRTRQRPRWLALVMQPSVRFSSRVVAGSPTMRMALLLLATTFTALSVIAGIAIGASLLPGPPPIPAERGVFRSLPSMSTGREAPTATLLLDGRVLVTGGYGGQPQVAEVWDPATETFARTGSMGRARYGSTAVRLDDGRVLIAGGIEMGPEVTAADGSTSSSAIPVLEAEIWDPASGRFTNAGTLNQDMISPTATLQADGRVLVSGRVFHEDGWLDPWTAEVWDPETLAFSPTRVPPAFAMQRGTTLRDGRRLLLAATGDGMTPETGPRCPSGTPDPDWPGPGRCPAGGSDVDLSRLLDARVWDPVTDTVEIVGGFRGRRIGAVGSLLPDGRVLISGGDGTPGNYQDCGRSAEIWDPATGVSDVTGVLGEARAQHAAAVLADGRVLLVGAYWTCPGSQTAEIFEFH